MLAIYYAGKIKKMPAVQKLPFYIVFVLITKNKTPFVLAQGKVGAAGDWETWSCFLEP